MYENKSQKKGHGCKVTGKKVTRKKSQEKSHIYKVIFQIINLYFVYTVINILFLNRDPVVYLVHAFNS